MLENKRFLLRELQESDYDQLAILTQDPEVMYAYEAPLTDEQVAGWIAWNQASYRDHGFGLWVIVSKIDQAFIGICGIVYSEVEGDNLLEVGYLLNKAYWHQGYATEASSLCIDYAKNYLKELKICSIIRVENQASINVALRNKMVIVKKFAKDYSGTPVNHYVYSLNLT